MSNNDWNSNFFDPNSPEYSWFYSSKNQLRTYKTREVTIDKSKVLNCPFNSIPDKMTDIIYDDNELFESGYIPHINFVRVDLK